jgi:hypothetical protein
VLVGKKDGAVVRRNLVVLNLDHLRVPAARGAAEARLQGLGAELLLGRRRGRRRERFGVVIKRPSAPRFR